MLEVFLTKLYDSFYRFLKRSNEHDESFYVNISSHIFCVTQYSPMLPSLFIDMKHYEMEWILDYTKKLF
jgi:hypothetical protein